MRGVRADELEAERAKAVLAGALDGRQLRAGHPQRRMRLLHRFRHHVAQGNVEILAVMLGADFREHRKDRLHRFLEHLALGLHVAAERRQFGNRRAFAHAELAAAVAQEIEHRDPFGDTRGMIGGELENAVAEPDLLRALAGCGEKRFRRGRVRIFLEEMMFHHPGVVIAEPVGGLELGQRVLVEPELVALFPWARQLQLVKDAEFHDASQNACCFRAVYSPCHPKSSLGRETAIPWRGSSLAWNARMVSFTLPLSRGLPPALLSIWTP